MNRFSLLLIGLAVLIALGTFLLSRGRDGTRDAPTDASTTNLSIVGARDPTIRDKYLLYEDVARSQLIAYDLNTGTQNQSWPIQAASVLQSTWDVAGSHAAVLLSAPVQGWMVLDKNTNQETKLHPNIRTLAWHPNKPKLAYIYIDPNGPTFRLTLADARGENWETLLTLPINHGLTDLWWSPLETYMVGLDETSTPPRYVRILVSSKRMETLAEGSGDVRWSPSGKLALLDGVEVGQVNIAAIETGKVTPLGATAAVRRLAWENEDALVGLVTHGNGQTRLSRIALADKSVEVIDETIYSAETDSVIGMHGDLIYLFGQGAITTAKIKK